MEEVQTGCCSTRAPERACEAAVVISSDRETIFWQTFCSHAEFPLLDRVIQANAGIRSGSFTGGTFSGIGSSLSNLSAANLTFGTLGETLLSGNAALLDSSPAFSGQVSAGSGMRLNDRDLWLRPSGSANGPGWYGTGKLFAFANINGPVLFGTDGGALGQVDGRGESISFRWNSLNRVGIGRDAAANRPQATGWRTPMRASRQACSL